jgi:G6PDH family F420-dependent oxidoreductase
MATFGYFLLSETWGPTQLVEQAVRAQQAGFDRVWLSDHFHPWTTTQGESPFVWGTIGALSQAAPGLTVTTAVTCPTVRTHPAIVAHAAATAAVQLEASGGRFNLGVGSGEALNEHVHGDKWPVAEVRLEMLEEAVEVMRALWKGEMTDHWGKHYTVENARIFTRPQAAPPVYVSGFGPKAVELAARIGDGYVGTSPDRELVELFETKGGAGKPKQAGLKVCWGEDAAQARKAAHQLWPTSGVPGQLSQDLPTPTHFEQASENVTEDQVAESTPCGPDLAAHVEAIKAYVDAGYDEIYVAQIGPDQEGFFRFWEAELGPELARL